MRPRYRLTAAMIALLMLVLTGGLWIGLADRYAPGHSALAVTIMGGAFSAVFIWLLLTRLRILLARPDRRMIEFALLAINLAVLIFAFAWVHHEIGLMDVSGPAPRPTNDLGDALYFSIVTSTTLGYGDFIPLGPGRPLAAIQALTGYTILGILVSTGFRVIAPGPTVPGPAEGTARSGGDDDAAAAEERS